MKTKSIREESFQKFKHAFKKSTNDGFTPTLAIAFISNLDDRDSVRLLLKENGVALFGLSSNGEFIDDDYEGLSISLMLFDMNPDYFYINFKAYNDKDPEQIAFDLGESAKERFKNPAFIISSCNTLIPASQIISGLVKSVGKETTIIGGNAAAPSLTQGNHIFTEDELSYDAMIALIIDKDKIEIQGAAVSGWKSIGTLKKVTKSEGAWIYTIDDKPALDTFLKYLGKSINEEDIDDLFEQAGTFYPLQLEREHGDPVMRAVMFFDRDKRAIICAGSIPEGSMIQFSLPPDFEVGEKVVESSEKIRDTVMPEVDAVLVFSCLGRLSSLGPMVGEEIGGLKATWNAPLLGFFTFGEYGRIENGATEYHNTTVSWAALKEKE